MPFDAAHERLRKKQLSLLLARTAEEVEEDEFVGAEMKKINQVWRERFSARFLAMTLSLYRAVRYRGEALFPRFLAVTISLFAFA